MGEEGDDIITSSNITSDERKLYTNVVKVRWIFKIWRNVIFERAKFYSRDQAEGESVEQIIIHAITDS